MSVEATRRVRVLMRVVLLGASLVFVFGCGAGESESPAESAAESADASTEESAEATTRIDVYDVRGRVTELPSGESSAVYIAHEAIPDFKMASGEVVGMDAMTMGFEIDPELLAAVEGVEVGAPVAFRFEYATDGSGIRIVSIERLSDDVELVLAGESPAHDDAHDHGEDGHDH